ncbi:MerR family transcriptional regulator [Domibacillus indicus]|uniref:MerR family transcriptional regulator n=1 Tax=Domibacillus indicus TaxID=1437523 RepID=UPI00069670EF|nr:MerR family transcriptional regulator [Domibacillus indicus]
MRELKAHIPTVQRDNGYHYFDKPALERLLLIRKLNREQNYSLKQIEYYFAIGEPVKPEPMNEDSSSLIREDLAVIMERLHRQEQFNQALVTKLDEQQQFNQELGTKLDKQEQYIKDSLKKRDQLLLESLKNAQEAKKAVLKKKWYKWW